MNSTPPKKTYKKQNTAHSKKNSSFHKKTPCFVLPPTLRVLVAVLPPTFGGAPKTFASEKRTATDGTTDGKKYRNGWQVIFGSTDFLSGFHETYCLIVKLFKQFNRLICFMNISTVIITYFALITSISAHHVFFWGGRKKPGMPFFTKSNHTQFPYFNLKGPKNKPEPEHQKKTTGSTSPRSPASQTDLNGSPGLPSRSDGRRHGVG